jgi:hypothetical protein
MKFKRTNIHLNKMLPYRHTVTSKQASFRWEAVTAISAAVSAVISLFIMYIGIRALTYTENQIEDFRKESQAQHLIEKLEEFDSQRYKAIRKGLAEKRLNTSTYTLKKLDIDDAPVELSDELGFCNDLGILTRHGALTAYDVWGEFSYWLFPMYADSQSVIKADQKDAPASWSNCDYLMEQVRKVEEQEDAGKQEKQQEEDIASFYYGELEENETHSVHRMK